MHRYILILGLALALPGAASALVIDSFDDSSLVQANSSTPSDSQITPSGSFLGTNRVLEASWTSGDNNVDGEVDAGGSSLLNISLGADTLGSVSLQWNSIGGVDLTEAATKNAISLAVAFDDLPADITITVTDTFANSGSASATSTPTFSCCTTESFFFAAFSGSVDFTTVDSIELVVTPDFPAADLQIDFIESAFVPEPGTGLLLGAGLLALAWRRRPGA